MAGRPNTFADLIQRIADRPAPDEVRHRPVFGQGVELDARGMVKGDPWWVILHGTSSSGAFLIHAHSIATRRVAVSIEAPLGAVLTVTLEVKSSRAVGELFETAAEFLEAPASPDESDDGDLGTG